jgi:uncharacterized alkaline shock family protein YloU
MFIAEDFLMPEKKGELKTFETGKTSYNRNIVNNITRLAVMQTAGVARLSRGSYSGLKKIFIRKYQNGVLVNNKSSGLFINVYIEVNYGVSVPEVAYKIQTGIKHSVESTTDFKVLKINVKVTGVVFGNKKIDLQEFQSGEPVETNTKIMTESAGAEQEKIKTPL